MPFEKNNSSEFSRPLSDPIGLGRLTEFEGLRGFLATWVIFGHILLFSGYTYSQGLFGILFSPVLGVYVFMMLSGFVITLALDSRKSTWYEFMKRRFFRIYPVYALSILLAILCIPVSQHVAEHFELQQFASENAERLSEVNSNFELYLCADSVLLQNLLPRTAFPYAHETFLPPTWSLSLEWMFYLVMPATIGLLRQPWRYKAIGVFSIVLAITLFHKQVALICPSLSLQNGSYFLTGIGSYFVWKRLPEIRGKHQWIAIIAFWSTLGLGAATLGLSFKMWLGVMAMLLYPRVHTKPIRILEWVRWVLVCKPIKFLGEISYSSYLMHWIVIEVCLFLGTSWFPQLEGRLLLAIFCCLTVFPITFAASHLLYQYIERPCIQFGSRGWRLRARPSGSVSAQS